MNVYVNPLLREAIERAAPSRALESAALCFCSVLYLKGVENGALADRDPSVRQEYHNLRSKLSQAIYTTRHYGPMLTILRELGAVQVRPGHGDCRANGGYQVDEYAKGYRLAPQYWVAERFTIDAPGLEARMDRSFERASYDGMRSPAQRWILESYRSASLSPDADEVLARRQFATPDARYRAENHVACVRKGRMRFSVSRESGRIYYSVASLPKELRRELLIDGEGVVEVDISCSQPALLATLYDAAQPTHSAERQRYLALLESGRFYEEVAPIPGWSRDELKTAFFHQIAYGSGFCPEKYPLLGPFRERFPVLARLMAGVKLRGNSELPLRMQELEARIVISATGGDCARDGLKILPVHDSLICKASDSEKVATALRYNWEHITGLPARLNISRKSALSSRIVAVA